MFCSKCGKENPPGGAFCIGCGSALGTAVPSQANNKPAPEVAQRPVKKKNIAALALGVISAVLAIALVLSLTGIIAISGVAGASVSSKNFSSPEDAINYFVERLKAGDFDGALSACAVGEMAKGFDYEAQAKRLRTLLPVATSYMPSEYEQYVAYNEQKLSGQMMVQMTSFIISLNLSDDYAGLIEGVPVVLEGDKLPEDIMEQLDPAAIEGLTIVDISKNRMHDNELNRENQGKQARVFGADDVQFRTVLYEYEGKYYMGGFTLIEYGGRWLIQSMSDPLSGIPVFGTPIEIKDESEYYGMFD